MTHVTLSDRVKLGMLNYLSKNRKIEIQYRSMEMFEYPILPTTTTSVIWQVKTVSSLSRPRYVILGFQHDRKNVKVKDASKFDHCNIEEVRLHLNSQIYPYHMDMFNIEDNSFAELYNAYSNIQPSYYNGTEHVNPFNLDCGEFQSSPLFTFDTSRADESLINSAIDIKIEIKTSAHFQANTSAYALILYDSHFSYTPFDSLVVRSV